MSIVNHGLVRGVISSATAPTHTNVLWRDTSVSPNLFRYYDTVALVWLPMPNQAVLIEDATTTRNVTTPGRYVYTGSAAAVWTFSETLASHLGDEYLIKNRASGGGSNTLTLARSGSDEFYDSAAGNSIVLYPGESWTRVVATADYWLI